ncbi:MAG TPA: hypothetical protein VIM12_06185 [Noviherbaspirillum sp.]|uniref:hypothetical protein n=1 Tax=Noviherbaspirillum sp. TaxID=1926288 RepID=UPI002F94624B
MHTLDVIDSALQWETERQNRLHQQALDLKKKQARDEDPASRPANARTSHHIAPAAVQDLPTVAAPAQHLPDLVGRIPVMRSALMPLDEAAEGSDWSRPFALTKADIAPWTSYLEGYYQSRLFLEPVSGAGAASSRDASRLDYAVRALLTLKGLPVRVITEPPVQINRQVEYHDLDAELRAGQGRLRADTQQKLAVEMHQKQLAKAVENGRQLGDALYEAMMGEGYGNLVHAWERAHGRKPTVDELHVMLSTGKVKPGRVSKPAAVSTDERMRVPPLPALSPERPSLPATPPARAGSEAAPADFPDEIVTLGALPQTQSAQKAAPKSVATRSTAKPSMRQRVVWYLLHATATACSAAAIAYVWMH